MPVDDRRTAEGLFGKKGTVSAVRKGILSFLKLKGKGYLYGGRVICMGEGNGAVVSKQALILRPFVPKYGG